MPFWLPARPPVFRAALCHTPTAYDILCTRSSTTYMCPLLEHFLAKPAWSSTFVVRILALVHISPCAAHRAVSIVFHVLSLVWDAKDMHRPSSVGDYIGAQPTGQRSDLLATVSIPHHCLAGCRFVTTSASVACRSAEDRKTSATTPDAGRRTPHASRGCPCMPGVPL
jgi:hypothetical protein